MFVGTRWPSADQSQQQCSSSPARFSRARRRSAAVGRVTAPVGAGKSRESDRSCTRRSSRSIPRVWSTPLTYDGYTHDVSPFVVVAKPLPGRQASRSARRVKSLARWRCSRQSRACRSGARRSGGDRPNWVELLGRRRPRNAEAASGIEAALAAARGQTDAGPSPILGSVDQTQHRGHRAARSPARRSTL